MMNRRSFLQTITSGALLGLVALAVPAEAQRFEPRGRADRPRVQSLIRQLENDTDALRLRADQITRRRRVDATRSRRLRDSIRVLENATDSLRADVDRRRTFDQSVSRRQADALIRAGERVQDVIQGDNNLSDELGSPWDRVRRRLNELARIYNVRTLRER